MKIYFVTLLVAVAVSFVACKNKNGGSGSSTEASLSATDASRAPVISFETNTYDFGKIKQGEKISYDFKFTNKGKSPLIISNATASCGCTVPDYPREPIGPGKSAAIKVVFDSAGKDGMQHKAVTITSNAEPSTAQIYLVGEVER